MQSFYSSNTTSNIEMKIEAIAIGAGILAAIALLVSQAKATPAELLTLELQCVGGSLDACLPSSTLNFTGDYTSDGVPIEDTVHIVQFGSEADADTNTNGTEIGSAVSVNGHYSYSWEAPVIEGTYYYKAYNDEQYALYILSV